MNRNLRTTIWSLSILLCYTIGVSAENIDSGKRKFLSSTPAQEDNIDSKYTITFVPQSPIDQDQEIEAGLTIEHVFIGLNYTRSSTRIYGGIIDSTTPARNLTLTAGIYPFSYSFDDYRLSFPKEIFGEIRLGPSAIGITLGAAGSMYNLRDITPKIGLDIGLGARGSIFVQTDLEKWHPSRIQLGINYVP